MFKLQVQQTTESNNTLNKWSDNELHFIYLSSLIVCNNMRRQLDRMGIS